MKLLKTSKKLCQKINAGKLLLFPYPKRLRFAVFELEWDTQDGRKDSKILFILYAPDVCSTSMKFPYAACKDDIRKACQPVSKEI